MSVDREITDIIGVDQNDVQNVNQLLKNEELRSHQIWEKQKLFFDCARQTWKRSTICKPLPFGILNERYRSQDLGPNVIFFKLFSTDIICLQSRFSRFHLLEKG